MARTLKHGTLTHGTVALGRMRASVAVALNIGSVPSTRLTKHRPIEPVREILLSFATPVEPENEGVQDLAGGAKNVHEQLLVAHPCAAVANNSHSTAVTTQQYRQHEYLYVCTIATASQHAY
jgi:hypothetical protein